MAKKGMRNRKRIILIILAIILLGIIILPTQVGFYTVHPIDSPPLGITLLVWRNAEDPFYNSPDAFCLQAISGPFILCRELALDLVPYDRVIMELPYWEWAYLRSTGGEELALDSGRFIP